MKILKKIFGSALSAINIIFIILMIISAYSDLMSSDTAIALPFMGLLFPCFLIINILFFIWWLFTRSWELIVVSLLAFGVCYQPITTYFPIHFREKEVPIDCIKVLTYNIMQFEHKRPHKKNDPNPILQYIANSDADIICLQEYGTTRKKPYLSEEDVLTAMKDYPYHKILKLKWHYKLEDFGLAIFSRYPILSLKNIDFETRYNGAFIAELDINGKKTTLINVHLESNKLSMEERVEYDNMLNDFDSKKLDDITEKMARRLTPAFKFRAAQAERIAYLINTNKNPYIIVCGDFNDTPISYVRRTIGENLLDSYAETGFGIGNTYNKNKFYFRIDYILHSKNIKAYNCTVDKIKNSDHYPVWTFLQFN